VFGHIPALPSAGSPDTMLVELSGDLDGNPATVQDIAPGDPLGTQAEMRLAPTPPALAEGPGPDGNAQPPAPGTPTGVDPEPEAEAIAAAIEAQAVLEGQVESLTADRAELIARLATEHQRAARLEQRLLDLEHEREIELAAVRATYERLVEALRGEVTEQEVALRNASGRLSVSIVDRVLFPSGGAALNPAGRRIMDKVSEVLTRGKDHRILVEGHTDDVPIGPALRERFPSNWELSTARATEVAKYLTAHGVPSERLTAAGRADTAPVANNHTEDGRRQNRRIEIIVLPPEHRPSDPALTELP
jgi:chemotaxis protein MotB